MAGVHDVEYAMTHDDLFFTRKAANDFFQILTIAEFEAVFFEEFRGHAANLFDDVADDFIEGVSSQ